MDAEKIWWSLNKQQWFQICLPPILRPVAPRPALAPRLSPPPTLLNKVCRTLLCQIVIPCPRSRPLARAVGLQARFMMRGGAACWLANCWWCAR